MCGMAKARSAASIRSEIADALAERPGVYLISTEPHVYGVCRVPLQVKVEFAKSVFTPVERIEKRAVGQFFLVRPVAVPAKGEPDMRATFVEDKLERENGAICVTATSADEALEKLRERGLPV